MKRLKYITALVLSAIMLATNVCPVCAAEYTEVNTESESESPADNSVEPESAQSNSNDEQAVTAAPDEAVVLSDIIGSGEDSEDSTEGGLEISVGGTSEDQPAGSVDPDEDESAGGAAEPTVELITTSGSGYNSYSSDLGDDLTVILRGLNESNKTKTVEYINEYISTILETGTPLSIIGSSYVDAEKYNTQVTGYDSNHCWAATASNILWTTGYAQKAINPYTGNYFASEDEVLTYFSENFTDYAGAPDAGSSWFFTGNYPYNGYAGIANTTDDSSGGLLPEEEYSSGRSYLTNINYNSSAISALESVGSYGMGVLVRWLQSNGKLTDGAHWMTVVGTLIDENEQSVYDRYKAIVLANSDDNPVNTSSDYSETSWTKKLNAKASQPDTYTVYRLSYDSTNDWWTIDNFSSLPTVITYLYSLLDSNKTTEGCSDENGTQVIISEETQEIFIIEPEDASRTMTEEYFYSLTTEELNKPENLTQLRDFMVNNNIPAFLPSKGVVSEDQELDIFVTAPQTFIYEVTADDTMLPTDAFYITETKDGLSKLMIKDSYLKKLSKGRHIIRIKIQGLAAPVELEINII